MAPTPSTVMTAYKHPIAHHWIKQTLIPFLLFAFASTLPYPADISAEIQRLIDFALVKPDHPSDGDDMIFERIFMALMHGHKDLAPDLTMIVDNIEPCAKYLIRRAQLKGPFELLGRTDVGSSAWMESERQRLSTDMVEREEAGHELRPPVRLAVAAPKMPPTEDDIDPRLVYAQPGHFAIENLSGQLTAEENSYYRQQNRNYAQAQLQRQQQSLYMSTAPAQMTEASYAIPGRGYNYTTSTRESPYSQQQQKISQQSSVPLVYTPQQTDLHQTPSFHQTNATAQSQQQMQAPQPQAMPLNTSNTIAPSRAYLHKQHTWPQYQSAQLPPAQHDDSIPTPRFFPVLPKGQPMLPPMTADAQPPRLPQVQIQPSQYQPGQQQTSQHEALQHQQARLISEGRQILHIPHALPQTPSQSALQPQQTPPPRTSPNRILSSDFAHLRGNDWSNAAQQRAREIAAKITAQERDSMARSIIRRQKTIAQQLPSLPSAASMYTPTYHVPQLPPRSHSATGLSDDSTPSYANASPYTNAPANLPTDTNAPLNYVPTRGTAVNMKDGWGMALPDGGRQSGGMPLPTLAEVRGRYHPLQLPNSTGDTAEGAFTSAAQMGVEPVQAQWDMLSQSHAGWGNGRTDALQQLRCAASQENGESMHPWLGGGSDASRVQDGAARFKDEGEKDVKMHGM